MSRLIEISQSFRAMNTTVEAVICAEEAQRLQGEQALIIVRNLFEKVEETLSRFRTESELSRMNKSAGRLFKASPLLFEVVRSALEAARDTDGIFDPTILPSLLSAGYNKSFEFLDRQNCLSDSYQQSRKYNWKDINLDLSTSSIYFPEGCSIDLGGIGKGWTVDRVSQYLATFSGYAVDAGGDIRVSGTQADGRPWTIGVADPLLQDHDLTTVSLYDGAICTSTTTKRRWMSNRNWQHHLIDPRSGKPSDSNIISATIVADSAVRAETFAKSALISGPIQGLRLIENQGDIQGLLVMEDGCQLTSVKFTEVRYVA